MSIWIILGITIALILIITSTILFFIQERMIFHAEKLPQDYKYFFNQDFEEINLKSKDGFLLNGVIFKVKQPKGIIYYLHNHSGNVEHWSRAATFFNSLGYDVLVVDYRGYGKSQGVYNEKKMFEDSLIWYDFLTDKFKESLITIYGRGIGATFATYIASLNNPKQLLLESPVYDIVFTANFHYPYVPFKRWIARYLFDTSAYIKNVKCKIYIIHGKKNKLVNYKNSVKLYQLAKQNIDLLLVTDANHYNLINSKSYLNKIKEIL